MVKFKKRVIFTGETNKRMSSFFSDKFAALTPYVPGEQPQDSTYIKLNTNESPFLPSPLAVAYAQQAAKTLHLYSDPAAQSLTQKASDYFGVAEDEIIFTNGSDEALFFATMAFCDKETPLVCPDITYGFYPVFAAACCVPCKEIPLTKDLRINTKDYLHTKGTIFIANPNAPTGIALAPKDIREILDANRDTIVLVDEAYIDFGAQSVLLLIHEYHNLVVTQTFSKSRSLAGGRLGMAFACAELIRDLNTVKYSYNPYNVNSMTMAAGIGALEDDAYMRSNAAYIAQTRAWTAAELKKLGFTCTDSKTNFLFAKTDAVSGTMLYEHLKAKGILVRHFDVPRITDYVRITIGTKENMQVMIDTLKTII